MTLSAWLGDFFGMLFLCSGLAKLQMYAAFRDQVAGVALLPKGPSSFLGYLIPPLEVATGAALLARTPLLPALGFAGFLLLAFTGFVAWALISGRVVACFCFGEKDHVISTTTLLRNLTLIALLGMTVLLELHRPGETAFDVRRVLLAVSSLSGVLLFLAGFHLLSLRIEYRGVL